MNEPMITYLFSANGYIISFVLVIVSLPNILSWDLAVANEGGINFFDLGIREIQSGPDKIRHLNDFYVLTYDSAKERIFFSVNEYSNTSIFEFNLREKTLIPLVSKQNHSVQGISHDTFTQTLFWTDGNGHTIWKRSLANESNSVEVVLNFETEIPTGIAISFCKRLLFWTNSNHLSPSIDRSDLDGSNHEKLITEDIFLPLAITVDEVHQKLYWTDDEKGIYCKIERSNLDGTDRELIIQRTHQEPFGIATAQNAIYWTDTVQNKIWMISLSNESESDSPEPELFYDFKQFTPYGIAAFREVVFECDYDLKVAIPIKRQNNSRRFSARADSNDSYCLNWGKRVGDGECRCEIGFSGDRCEISNCHNYCLNGGRCFLDGGGFAECQCLPGYLGGRCERDICSGFCLNGGRCSINDSVPLCSCGAGFSGRQCETSPDSVCLQICARSFKSAVCDCNSTSPKFVSSMEYSKSSSPDSSQCRTQRVFTIFLICSEALTMLVVVTLARKICLLRRRPRIKKRIIVNKGVKSQTPMTARPQTAVSEQCEITIENCCNMNICETPCFEPNILSARLPSTTLLPKKSEDKKKLLKSMEEEFEGSDILHS